MKSDMFSDLAAMPESEFQALDSDITVALKERDKQYAALLERIGELEQQVPIEEWLEGEGAVSMTAEEHAALKEYMRLTFDTESRERRNLYIAGHRNCLAYLKQIGMIK